jgi:hypothetical protein
MRTVTQVQIFSEGSRPSALVETAARRGIPRELQIIREALARHHLETKIAPDIEKWLVDSERQFEEQRRDPSPLVEIFRKALETILIPFFGEKGESDPLADFLISRINQEGTLFFSKEIPKPHEPSLLFGREEISLPDLDASIQPGPCSSLASRRGIPGELDLIRKEFLKYRQDAKLAPTIEKWLEDSEKLFREKKNDPDLLVQEFRSALEKILASFLHGDFPPDPIAEFLLRRMSQKETLFYSRFIQQIVERRAFDAALLKELEPIQELILRSNPNSRFVQCVDDWVKRYQNSLQSKKLLGKGQFFAPLLVELEDLLRDPFDEGDNFPIVIFSKTASPLAKRLIDRMTDKSLPLYSEIVDQACQKAREQIRREDLQKRIENIGRLKAEARQLENEAIRRSRSLADRIGEFSSRQAEKLSKLVQDSNRFFALDREQIAALKEQIIERKNDRLARAKRAEERIATLEVRIDHTKIEQAEIEMKIGEVEQEQVKLRQEVQELHEAIEEKKNAFIRELVIHVAIAVASWGAAEAFELGFQVGNGMVGVTTQF